LRGGGPDNITCIVADVLDTATSNVPPSELSVVAGAVSNQGSAPMAHADTPANRAHRLILPDAPDEESLSAANGRVGGDQPHRRPWPIVTAILVVLVVVIVGGGFAAWSYTQHQYFVGASNGQVAIFRGVNQKVAGISLSSVYHRTSIPIAQVTMDDRQQVMSTITASSLAEANRIVSSIQDGVRKCEQATAHWHSYQVAEQKYKRQLAAYNKLKHKHGVHKPTPPTKPSAIPTNCPGSANGGSPGSAGTGSPSTGPASPSPSGSTP
ncbi:MAG: hypothetical protein LBV34_07380, partial [Nocardiopsaceae bacterium]|nr:hypothetical protein [Nocardiopsaceae bacterium]